MIAIALTSNGYSTKVFHAPYIAALPEEYRIHAIVERHGETARQAFPQVKIYKSCEELFTDPVVDVVVINTPSPTHYAYARQALLAGKHVVVDKPFAATAAEGESLIELAKQQNKLITVYHNRRMEGELLAVKQVVDNALLGRLIEAEFRFERFRQGLNPKRHKEENAPGNGIVYELCTHLIDQALFIFGSPQRVAYAEAGKIRDFTQVDDYCHFILHYHNGLRVSLRCSLLAAQQAPAYVIHGSQGSFVKYRSNILEEQLSSGMQVDDPRFAREPEESYGHLTLITPDSRLVTTPYPTPVASYIDFYRQLAQAIRGQAAVPVDPRDAVEGLRLLDSKNQEPRART